jgi:hypothetical protein
MAFSPGQHGSRGGSLKAEMARVDAERTTLLQQRAEIEGAISKLMGASEMATLLGSTEHSATIASQIEANQQQLHQLQMRFEEVEQAFQAMMAGDDEMSDGGDAVQKLCKALVSVMGTNTRPPADHLFRQLESKVKVPVLSSKDPKDILNYLSEVSGFLELGVISEVAQPHLRNRLLTTGWRGDVLNKFSILSSARKAEVLALPTEEFVAHWRGQWFPQTTMQRCLKQFMKGTQDKMSIVAWTDRIKSQRVALQLLGRNFSDETVYDYWFGGLSDAAMAEVDLWERRQDESLDAYWERLEAHMVNRKAVVGGKDVNAVTFEFDECEDDNIADMNAIDKPALVCFGCGQKHRGLWKDCRRKGKCTTCGGDHLTEFHSRVEQLRAKSKSGKANRGSE